MQLIQFIAAWLFPGAVCFAVDMAAADSSELDRASSAPSSSGTGNAAGSGSSPSSSSSGGRRHSRSRQESPSTTPLCFGTGSGGAAGRRLLRGSRARAAAPANSKQQEPEGEAAAATMAAPKVKGDAAVGRSLRNKISRRLSKVRSDGKGSPPPPPPPMAAAAAAVDDTARERAESVARAISYCKVTLRRGSTSPSPSPPPPPPPSPSLDEWLHDRQEEIVASAAAMQKQNCDECRDGEDHSRSPPAAARPLLGTTQTMAKRFKEESPCPAAASPSRWDVDGWLAATAVVHGEEPSPQHGHGCHGGESMRSSLDEMKLLKTLDGDEEMINRHFITTVGI